MGNFKKSFGFIIFIVSSLFLFNCEEQNNRQTLTGADLLVSENLDLIKSKNLGIITNHTGRLISGIHLVDTLVKIDDISISALFGPEHGIRGNSPDGHSIKDGFDAKTGIPVYSLYGKIRKPTPEMMKNIDLLIFDIQDVGARFYTFISTMYYGILSAAENDIPIIILDRPNPINGIDVQGPVLDPQFKSFVGIAEIPIRHGMTVGELALFFNQPSILGIDDTADVRIIKMKNWKRDQYFDETGLHWINPSPNMPSLETAIVYPGLCLIEGTNISEGRGTFTPFLTIGAPYIISSHLLEKLNEIDLLGVQFDAVNFTPVSIQNMSTHPKYINEKCEGIRINITDRSKFDPVSLGINLIYTIRTLYPSKFNFRDSGIDRLWGNSTFRQDINNGTAPNQIIIRYESKLKDFKKLRKKYLLY